jgi:DNA-binding GntR family transcriptional regulator
MPLPQAPGRISRTLAREDAYDRLRGWIIEGTLQPAEVLRDQDIATALGVSRTPVREALRRLEDEGFVETASNRWTRVAPIDLTKAAQTYAIIEALELLALQEAFPRLGPEHVQALRHANGTMQQAAAGQEPALALKADESFHETWIRLANNRELELLLGQFKAKLRRVELAYFDAESRANLSFREHAVIIKALKKRSLVQARAALRRNWRGSLQRLCALAQSRATAAPP